MASEPYPADIDEAERQSLVQVVKDWTIAHGLAVRPPPAVVSPELDPSGILATSAPVTLFPSPFPRACFVQAKLVQHAYNELYSKISQDQEFLTRIASEFLTRVSQGDEFITNLWNVHLKVKEEGYVQPLSLGLFRSDYLVHQDPSDSAAPPQIKQVEFNTIASSFGGLSSRTTQLHRFLAATEYSALKAAGAHIHYDLPDNTSVSGLAAGLRAAFDAYSDSELGLDRCIVFLVQGGERNVFDQRHLEYQVNEVSPPIPVFRLPFSEILQRTAIADSPRRQLLYRLPTNPAKLYEVSVVYLRAGYGPSDYPGPSDWEARYQVERSAAIKCPTVLTQMAGTKKVQQVLATPKDGPGSSELDRFMPDGSDAAERIRATFTHIYPRDASPAGQRARAWARDPAASMRYVLKPQREGGGNNYYKSKIPEHLSTVPEDHWKNYILMELITPPPVSNMILRNGALEHGGVICELGIYGACVWDQGTGKMLYNEEAGYLLRTKGDQSEEGGVAAGYGCMDSCNLVD